MGTPPPPPESVHSRLTAALSGAQYCRAFRLVLGLFLVPFSSRDVALVLSIVLHSPGLVLRSGLAPPAFSLPLLAITPSSARLAGAGALACPLLGPGLVCIEER